MKVWYLAHPIAGDEKFRTEQNLEHLVEAQKILLEGGIYTVAPYYSWIVAFGGAADFKQINTMLDIDCECVRSLYRIMLIGHKLSRGMGIEKREAERNGLAVVDLIGVPNSQLVQAYKERYLDAPLPF